MCRLTVPSSAGIAKVQNPQRPQPSPNRPIPPAESNITPDTRESKPIRLWTDGDTAANKPNMLGGSSCTNAKAAPRRDTLCQDKSICPWAALWFQKHKPHFPHVTFSHLTLLPPTCTQKEKHHRAEVVTGAAAARFVWVCVIRFYWKQSSSTLRRSPPEQYSMARRGTSFTRKFISSGTSQALTTLGWFSLSTRRTGWKLSRETTDSSVIMFYVPGTASVPHRNTCSLNRHLPLPKCIKSIPQEYRNQW